MVKLLFISCLFAATAGGGLTDRVLAAMDARYPEINWDSEADVDDDGEVTSTDLSYVLAGIPVIGMDPKNLAFGPNEDNKTLLVWNRNFGTPLEFNLDGLEPWLVLSQTSGVSTGNKVAIMVTIDRTLLPNDNATASYDSITIESLTPATIGI